MKLILGSAAWRVNYGSFSKGPLADDQIEKLAAQAALLGFEVIDTAPSYGDAEEVSEAINQRGGESENHCQHRFNLYALKAKAPQA